jgi:hypothetical protein
VKPRSDDAGTQACEGPRTRDGVCRGRTVPQRSARLATTVYTDTGCQRSSASASPLTLSSHKRLTRTTNAPPIKAMPSTWHCGAPILPTEEAPYAVRLEQRERTEGDTSLSLGLTAKGREENVQEHTPTGSGEVLAAHGLTGLHVLFSALLAETPAAQSR